MTGLANIYELIKAGGPLAVAAVFAFMWWTEQSSHRRTKDRQEDLEDKILELAVEQTQAATRLELTLVSLKDMLVQVINRL